MKTRRRSAKKLVLPLLAVGMMTAAMAYDGSHRSPHASSHAPAAARLAPLHTR